MKQPKHNALAKALDHMGNFRLWSDEEQEHSLQTTLMQLPEIKNIWIFGYASLIWRPDFTYEEERLATLQSYSRSLCLWSSVNRGTKEQPGLVFGLTQGGHCEGKVYRLANNEDLIPTMRQLWKREMPSNSYIPMWLDCDTTQGIIKALVFVTDREDHSYIGSLSRDETIDIVLDARGHYGTCTEYVLETNRALQQAKITDKDLHELSALIEKRMVHKTVSNPTATPKS